MQIEVRNRQRQKLFRVQIPADRPPAVVRDPRGHGEVFLEWDQALDDRGLLRRCPVCGCKDLFARRDFPPVLVLGLSLLAVGVAVWLFAEGHLGWAVAALCTIVVLDAVVFFLIRRKLVCYRCRSEFTRLPIRHDHPGWNPAVAEAYK